MLKSLKFPMTLVRVGSIMLIITAFFHVYLGYPYVSNGMVAANLDLGVSGDVKAVWIGFALHLFFIAYLLLANSRRNNHHNLVLMLCGLIVLADGQLVRIFLSEKSLVAQAMTVSGLLILVGTFWWFLIPHMHHKAPVSINS
jgi:hypothetical protein